MIPQPKITIVISWAGDIYQKTLNYLTEEYRKVGTIPPPYDPKTETRARYF